MRHIILYNGEDGWWIAECPSLPGCVSQGKTVEEAMKNVREAVQAYIEALEMDNVSVPADTRGVMVEEV